MSDSGRRDSLVLDTGPLLTYLALHYLDRTGAAMARRDAILRDIRPDDPDPFAETEQERFLKLLRTARTLTTAYVLSEAFRLRDQSPLKQDRVQFRRLSLEPFTGGHVEELPLPLREWCAAPGFGDLACRLGLADASVLYLGLREGCAVLTDERRMFQAFSAGTPFQLRLLREYLGAAP